MYSLQTNKSMDCMFSPDTDTLCPDTAEEGFSKDLVSVIGECDPTE